MSGRARPSPPPFRVALSVVAAAAALLTGCGSTSPSPTESGAAVGTTTGPAPTTGSASPDLSTPDAAGSGPGLPTVSGSGHTPARSPMATPSPQVGDPVRIAGLPDEGLSGLVAVPGDPARWFAVTDRAGSTDLYLLDAAGGHHTWPVHMPPARNLEALSPGPCGPDIAGPCLYLADIGNNDLSQDTVSVVRVVAPTVDGAPAADPLPAEVWRYAYPDGPHDAEALAVSDDGTVLLVTKASEADPGHRVYTGAPGGGDLVLRHTFDPPAPERPWASLLVGTVVTDLSWDGSRMLVLTYDQVLEYTAPGREADPADFPTWPVRERPHPDLLQTEGIAGAADGCGYTVLSEGRSGPPGLATVTC